MHPSLRNAAAFLACAMVCLAAPVVGYGQGVPSIRRVQVLRGRGQVEIEVEASDRIVPQTNVLTNPDRLVVDFVNALPGAQLRNQAVNREEVKSLRVGLFSADPPVTRIVLDLNGPQPYQVFPSGRTTIVKVGTPGAETARVNPAPGPALVNTSYPVRATDVSVAGPAKPRLEVSFRDGMLSISSDRASLSEILFAVHQRTGAEIAIPAGAEQEKVAVDLGPAPAPEVLAHLLNGSKFNFLIMNSASDPRALDQVILSPRAEGPTPVQAARPQQDQAVAEEDDEAAVQPRAAPPVRGVPPTVENRNPPTDGQVQPAPPPNNVPD